MSTPCVTEFVDYDGSAVAAVYRHWDGYPEGAGADVSAFLRQVEEDTPGDTRFADPSYLAARYVVFLADMFRDRDAGPLAFISVGIMPPGADYGQSFTYRVDCGQHDAHGRPLITATDYAGEPVEVTR